FAIYILAIYPKAKNLAKRLGKNFRTCRAAFEHQGARLSLAAFREPPTHLCGWGSAFSAKPRRHTGPGRLAYGGGSRHRMSKRTRAKTSPNEWSMLGGGASAPSEARLPSGGVGRPARWGGARPDGAEAAKDETAAADPHRSPRRGEPRFARRPRGRASSVRWRSET